MKHLLVSISLITLTTISKAQTNFSGTWSNPELEMISGKQYANAVPKQITVAQTKDSIKITTVEVGDAAVPFTQTLATNGKETKRVGKTSKRTIRIKATWSDDKKTLTINTTYSYAEKPDEIEYNNTEVWELSSDGNLIVTKTSDATVTDDWTIKAVYSKD